MRTRLLLAAVSAVALATNSSVQGAIELGATLTNGAETSLVVPTLTNGQARPASFGNATLLFNDAQTSLTMTIEVHNIDFTGTQTADINDNLTAAHIHAGPGVTPATTASPVWGFIGAPFNDNNPTDTVITPFGVGVGATIVTKWDAPEGQNTTLAAQIDNLINGRAYLNFHTTQFAGGEIRGNIFVVPEPFSVALLGLGGVALMARRRSVKLPG